MDDDEEAGQSASAPSRLFGLVRVVNTKAELMSPLSLLHFPSRHLLPAHLHHHHHHSLRSLDNSSQSTVSLKCLFIIVITECCLSLQVPSRPVDPLSCARRRGAGLLRPAYPLPPDHHCLSCLHSPPSHLLNSSFSLHPSSFYCPFLFHPFEPPPSTLTVHCPSPWLGKQQP